jgi:hypothetical protein
MKAVRCAELTGAVPIDRRGHRSYEFDLRLIERDKYLREAAARFCAGMSDRQAAAMLRTKLMRYREGGWRRDASETTPPTRLAGRIEAYCWRILKSRDAIPGDRTVRDALARSNY